MEAVDIMQGQGVPLNNDNIKQLIRFLVNTQHHTLTTAKILKHVYHDDSFRIGSTENTIMSASLLQIVHKSKVPKGIFSSLRWQMSSQENGDYVSVSRDMLTEVMQL